MRRIYMILAAVMILSCLPFVLKAQGHLGIKGGANISAPRSEMKTNVGWHAGLTYQHDLPLWFSVQPELLFDVQAGQASAETTPLGLGYLKFPVNIQWGPRFLEDEDLRVFVQGSPFIGYAISKDIKDIKNGKEQVYGWEHVNRFVYGVGAGLGIQFRRFQLTAQYNWILSDFLNRPMDRNDTFKDTFGEVDFSGYTVSLAILLF